MLFNIDYVIVFLGEGDDGDPSGDQEQLEASAGMEPMHQAGLFFYPRNLKGVGSKSDTFVPPH